MYMKFINDYIEYLKDNPEHYWFKRKPFGWGWTPVTWQGWLVTVIFVCLIILNAIRLDVNAASESDFLNPFLLEALFLLGIFIWICFKTGEKPRWEWGFPKKDDKHTDR